MTGASSFDTEEALIESIKGIFLGNDKTKTGGAFHKVIEGDYVAGPHSYVIADGIAFTPAQAEPAFRYKSQHPAMIHEVNVKKIYQVGEYQIYLSGRIDGAEGLHIRDAKTKFRSIDWQEYLDSYQWRYYLDMQNTDVFFYDVFEVRYFNDLRGNPPYTLPGVEFLPAETIKCERYDSMEADCLQLLHEFMGYIDNRNFYHLLKVVNETPVL